MSKDTLPRSVPAQKPDPLTDSAVPVKFLANRFRPKDYATAQGCPDRSMSVALGKTSLGSDWAYFYISKRRVWNCNETFFRAHFTENKS